MALVEKWVDPSAPDGGTGTYASPYSSQDTAVALSAVTYPELVIRLKRGLIYKPLTQYGTLYIQGKSPANYWRVESYGDAEMPPTLFAGTNLLPGDSGWVYVSDGLWKKAMASNGASSALSAEYMRLYVGGSRPTGPVLNKELGTGYVYGTARAKYPTANDATEAEVLALVGSMGSTAERIWTYTTDTDGTAGTLYIYTGTALQDPPTYYDGITIVGSAGFFGSNGWTSVPRSVGIYSSDRVVVTQLDSLFAPVGFQAWPASTDRVACGYENCRALAFGSSGLFMDGATSQSITDFFARNISVDAIATLDEDWNFRDKYSGANIQWLNARQDAVLGGRNSVNLLFDRVRSKDGYHSGWYMGNASQNTVNMQIVDCSSTGPNRLYGGQLSIIGLGAANTATVARFNCSDTVMFIAKTGSGSLVVNDSLFRDAKRPYSKYDATATNLGLNTIPGISLSPNAGQGAFNANAIVLNRSTVMQPYGFMVDLNRTALSGGDPPAGALVINDSLLIDTRWINDVNARTFNPGVYDKVGVSIVGHSSLSAGVMVMSGSYYYTGAAGQPRCSYENGNTNLKTLSAWSVISGTFNEADPQVDSSGDLLIGSPLLGASSSGAYGRDVRGRQRPNPASIGAVDVPRLRRVLVTDPASFT